jgi:uncharacterized protein (TIGR00255 family)
MTGYGRGMAEREGRQAMVEIRSVNHRFLDLKLRGAPLSPPVEEQVSAAVRAACVRGAITVVVRLDSQGAVARVDQAAAARVHAELTELSRALGLDQPVTLELLCAQPGVLVSREDEADSAMVAACVRQAVDQALSSLIRMREAEGKALAQDLDLRLGRLADLVEHIAALAQAAPEQARRRLEDHLGRLLQKSQISVEGQRLAQEVALLAERLDVTEELVRLRSHIQHVQALMAEAFATRTAVGRRLDFLVQELGREVNTVGSKSQSAEIARTVIEAKAELEKIREQVQNIE